MEELKSDLLRLKSSSSSLYTQLTTTSSPEQASLTFDHAGNPLLQAANDFQSEHHHPHHCFLSGPTISPVEIPPHIRLPLMSNMAPAANPHESFFSSYLLNLPTLAGDFTTTPLDSAAGKNPAHQEDCPGFSFLSPPCIGGEQFPEAKDLQINNEQEIGGKKRKRSKGGGGDGNHQEMEKPREVIHVRAKRGQATDSHSLAERVRRERINEKLRVLQDLVPGCYKTMGMAVMLDVIINYVQSLQNQIEFLSMKLSAASLFYDFNSPEAEAVEALQLVERTNNCEAREMERMVRDNQGYGAGGLATDGHLATWPF